MGAYIYEYIDNYDNDPVVDNYQDDLYDSLDYKDIFNDTYYEDDYYTKTYDSRIYKYSTSFQTNLLDFNRDYYIYDDTSFGNVDFIIRSYDDKFEGEVYSYGKKGTFNYTIMYYDSRGNIINVFDDVVNINNSYERFELYGINNKNGVTYDNFKFIVKDLVLYNEG